MKSRRMLVWITVAVMSTGLMSGQATFTEFEGKEVLAVPTPIDFGTLKCVGGEPLGTWPSMPPCTPGSAVHIRGIKWLYTLETNDPRLRGDEIVVGNGNWDGWTPFGPGSGPMWGTLRIEVKDGETKTGEVWEGTWTGIRTVTDDGARSSIQVVAHGSQGRVEGLIAKWDITYDPVVGAGLCKGWIIEAGGK